jgi:hypothetical protein
MEKRKGPVAGAAGLAGHRRQAVLGVGAAELGGVADGRARRRRGAGAGPLPGGAGNRRFGLLSALHAHTKAPYKIDYYGKR